MRAESSSFQKKKVMIVDKGDANGRRDGEEELLKEKTEGPGTASSEPLLPS